MPWRYEFLTCIRISLLAFMLSGCLSNGLAVESVTDYGPGDQLNAVASGDGFIRGMTMAGSPWRLNQGHWIDRDVWDTDFADGDIVSTGQDHLYFDQPGTAISYFSGHGITAHGCSSVSCSTTSACTKPITGGAGARLPGTCRFSPWDKPRCCYMVDRAAVTNGNGDMNGGIVNYTSGPIRWGESWNSGPWAGAGTNGGTNLVVLDISHGILPPFWYQTLRNAFAGVHMIATLMTAAGDTVSVAERGPMFAQKWRGYSNGNVAQAWLDTMGSLPTSLGDPCENLGGGRFSGGQGFSGCGCHIVVAMDSTLQGAKNKMNEDWIDLRYDHHDAKGNEWYSARWLCNYALMTTGQSAWELP
jgi:hypothetical protein